MIAIPAGAETASTVLESEEGKGVRVRYVVSDGSVPRLHGARPQGPVTTFGLGERDGISLESLIDGKPSDEELWGAHASAEEVTPSRVADHFQLTGSSESEEREPLRGLHARRSMSPLRAAERRPLFSPRTRERGNRAPAHEERRPAQIRAPAGRPTERRRSETEREDRGGILTGSDGTSVSSREGRVVRRRPERDPLAQAQAVLRGPPEEEPSRRSSRRAGTRVRSRRERRPERASSESSHERERKETTSAARGFEAVARELRKLRVEDGDGEPSGGTGGAGVRGYALFAKEKRRFQRRPELSLAHVFEQKEKQLGSARKLREFVATETQINNSKLFMMLGHVP